MRRMIAPAAALLVAVTACTSGSPSAGPTPTRAPALSPPPSGPPPSGPPPPSATGPIRPDHVVIVVFENKSYAQIAGGQNASYLNEVAAHGALLTNIRAETHPSQPNYVGLFAGTTYGVSSNRCPTNLGDRPNLGRQLLDAGLSFAGYSEDLPHAGYTGCSTGRYAAKHNPWVGFSNLPASVNLPFRDFPTDYSRLPTVSFVIPNLCDDMHDCSIAVGDQWARQHLDCYLRWARSHNSLLVITFDEDDYHAGNQIYTAFAGAGVKPGRYGHPVSHYRILATIEHLYGLPRLNEAAKTTPLTNIWSG